MGKTSAAVKNRWNSGAYDRITVFVKKGEKTAIQGHAESRGESTNAFINRAIAETIERDNGNK